MNENKVISVIGSAGRGSSAHRMTPQLYDAMYSQLLDTLSEWSITHGVSGGAAFSDHLIVRAYLEDKIDNLTLYIPAQWEHNKFVTTKGMTSNVGKTATDLHKIFSNKIGIDSLAEIQQASQKGADLQLFPGFFRRNTEVAMASTHMLAMTFGDMRAPQDFDNSCGGFGDYKIAGLDDGGTKDTWGKAWKCELKRHISLVWLENSIKEVPSARILTR